MKRNSIFGTIFVVLAVSLALINAWLMRPVQAQEFVENAVTLAFPHEIQCFNLSNYETVCRIKDTELGNVCYLYRGGFEAGGSISCP